MGEHSTSVVSVKDSTYDTLRRSATVVLPASGALYFTLAQIWGLPHAEEVVGTIAAVNTFVGVCVGVLRTQHFRGEDRFGGEINVIKTDTKDTYSLDLKGEPEELEGMKEITFKVNKP